MTVRLVRKEMGMGAGVPVQNAPAGGAQMPLGKKPEVPAMGQAPVPNDNTEIPDHTHPEYDKMMVKLQEIEGQLATVQPGGVNQDPVVDAGVADEDDEGRKLPMGKEFIETLRSVIREELKGIPEADKTRKKMTTDAAAQNIPQTKQPSSGVAPSGGGFDSNDKLADTEGDEAESKVDKPASEYPKLTIKKNKMELAKRHLERAKRLMKEAEDPTEPQPGEVKKKPEEMEGSAANRTAGGMEKFEKKDEDDDEEEEKKEVIKESKRESLVGMTSMTSEQTQAAHLDRLDVRSRVNDSIKEYLSKAGHGQALSFMQKA